MMQESQTPQQTPKQSNTVLIAIIVIVVLAVAGVAAMIFANPTKAPTTTQNEETGSNSETDANSNSSGTETATDAATITFTNTGFSPATLTVKKGTKVTVVNRSDNPVQFSSDDHPTHREDPELNMAELAPGRSGSFLVTTVGTHGFHDHIDDSMTGTLVVTE